MLPISVCIITKNEEKNIEQCLKALHGRGFEIIITDTGSTDRTKEIAEQYADEVLDFAWIDDFSAARNFCISHASHDVILTLDSDEFLLDMNADEILKAQAAHPDGVGLITLHNHFRDDHGKDNVHISSVDRLFNRKYYHYTQPIHEQLVPCFARQNYYTYPTSLTADHVGYAGSPEDVKKKNMRNLDLLLKYLPSEPDNPYLYFQIAQSYNVLRDSANACTYYKLALDKNACPADVYFNVLIINYGGNLLDINAMEDALSLLKYYNDLSDCSDYLCLIGSIYLRTGQPLKALPEYIKALSAAHSENPASRNIIPSFHIGLIYEMFHENDIAVSHYQKCGDYPPAKERLKQLVQFPMT